MKLNSLLVLLLISRLGGCTTEGSLEEATEPQETCQGSDSDVACSLYAQLNDTPGDSNGQYGTIGATTAVGTAITLDVSKDTNPNIHLEESYIGQLTKTLFTAYDGYCITSIVDDGVKVWTGTLENNCRAIHVFAKSSYRLITTVIMDGKKHVEKQFERVDGKWKEMGKEECDTQDGGTQATKKVERQPASQDYKLDIDNPNLKFVSMTERSTGGFTRVRYTANPKVKIQSVVAGDFVFWTRTSDVLELCNEKHKDDKRLLHLRVANGGCTKDLFFEHSGEWNAISPETFQSIMTTMRNIESTPKNCNTQNPNALHGSYSGKTSHSPFVQSLERAKRKLERELDVFFTLDIASPDNKRVKVEENDVNGIKETILKPRDGIFDRVMYAQNQLWTSKDGERCFAVKVYTKGARIAVFLQTIFKGAPTSVCFERNPGKWNKGGMWKEIEEDKFNEAVANMSDVENDAQNGEKMSNDKRMVSAGDYSGFRTLSIFPLLVAFLTLCMGWAQMVG